MRASYEEAKAATEEGREESGKDKATNCAGRRSWPPKINISELI